MTIWYYVLEKNARGERWTTQYIVYFMDHTNSEDTIFAVNTEIQMMYTSRWGGEDQMICFHLRREIFMILYKKALTYLLASQKGKGNDPYD